MTTLRAHRLRGLARPLAALAVVVAYAHPVSAQGPAQPADPIPVVGHRAAPDGAALLAANVARLTTVSAPARSTDRPRPFAAWSVSAQAFRDSILISVVRTAVGSRYVRGGQSFDGGFDCSGLVRYIMTTLDVPVPRTAAQQGTLGIDVGRDTARLRPGDLLTFGKGARNVTHVGIYVGHGRFVHASSAAGHVIESDIGRTSSPLVRAWRGARRIMSAAADADSSAKGDS